MPIARPQWPMFREVLRRQELMDDMMERCGVDVLDVIRRDRGQSFVRGAHHVLVRLRGDMPRLVARARRRCIIASGFLSQCGFLPHLL